MEFTECIFFNLKTVILFFFGNYLILVFFLEDMLLWLQISLVVLMLHCCCCRNNTLRSNSFLTLDPNVTGVFNGPYPFGIDPVSVSE